MLQSNLNTKMNKKGNRLYSLLLLMMLFFFNGCASTHRGDLTFKEPSDNTFNISGKIVLTDFVEANSTRKSLERITDFSYFTISAGNISTQVNKDGSYYLKGVEFSDNLVLKAKANKIELLCRVTPDEIFYSDLSALEINIKTTAEALVYQQGLLLKKNLTPSDIRAREYESSLASLNTAIKLALQLPKDSIATTQLEIPAITSAAKDLALNCLERERKLKDANSVILHAILRKDLELLKLYISPAFGNDWDSSSNWTDATNSFSLLFSKNTFQNFTWEVVDIELLADSKARIRTKVSAIIKNKNDEIVCSNTWNFDAIWRQEGTLWKIYRNMPYKITHPTQVDADSRWGELAQVFAELQNAVNREDIDCISNRVSDVFRNEFDGNSTKNDLILTAISRFNRMDVKISEYLIDNIQFTTQDEAKVSFRARIKVKNIFTGFDIDSGEVNAKVTFHKENGVWKVFRDLPYRFSHL